VVAVKDKRGEVRQHPDRLEWKGRARLHDGRRRHVALLVVRQRLALRLIGAAELRHEIQRFAIVRHRQGHLDLAVLPNDAASCRRPNVVDLLARADADDERDPKTARFRRQAVERQRYNVWCLIEREQHRRVKPAEPILLRETLGRVGDQTRQRAERRSDGSVVLVTRSELLRSRATLYCIGAHIRVEDLRELICPGFRESVFATLAQTFDFLGSPGAREVVELGPDDVPYEAPA
jgi:hypothetical protein